MRIIGVLDVLAGRVVAARGGQRATYQPIVSKRCRDASPESVCAAMTQACGLDELYLADLDRLTQRAPNHATWQTVANSCRRMWLDAGITSREDCQEVQSQLQQLDISNVCIICASETWRETSQELPTLPNFHGGEFAFSIDLSHGKILSPATDWQAMTPLRLIQRLTDAGWRRFVLLDITAVGGNQGCPTIDLCAAARKWSSAIEIITGGGIRDETDLQRLCDAGCDAALVGTAVHQGNLPTGTGRGHREDSRSQS